MPFRPNPNEQIRINNIDYTFSEHPSVPNMIYAQEGRAAMVYKLEAPGRQPLALKVLRPAYRSAAMQTLADKLARFAAIPGLEVCRRQVIEPTHSQAIVSRQPELAYAVLMPWVGVLSWMDIVSSDTVLSREHTLNIAHSLLKTLNRMADEEVAHNDLSAANLLLNESYLNGGLDSVALVDVEQLYSPALASPDVMPAGSDGYAHRTAHNGLWHATADRFAGAVLLAEILAWSDVRIREASWGESYFDQAEMPQEGVEMPHSERYALLCFVLTQLWGESVAMLFKQAWMSERLEDCPTFAAWYATLPDPVSLEAVSAAKAILPISAEKAEQWHDSDVISTIIVAPEEMPTIVFETQRSAEPAPQATPTVESFDTIAALDDLKDTKPDLENDADEFQLPDTPLVGWTPIFSEDEQRKQAMTYAEYIPLIPAEPEPAIVASVTSATVTKAAEPVQSAKSPEPVLPPTEQRAPIFNRRQATYYFTFIFAVLAGVVGGLIATYGVWLDEIVRGLGLGNEGTEALSASFLGLLVGCVQMWIFRHSTTGNRHIAFPLIGVAAGLVAGFVGGSVLTRSFDHSRTLGNGLWVGPVIGLIYGGLSSWLHTMFISSIEAARKWVSFTTLSATVVWGAGWTLAWVDSDDIIFVALGAFVIVLGSGIALSYLLEHSPEIEF